MKLNGDRTRSATLWLNDGSFFEIQEDQWPPQTHGDDEKAARTWAELTGLPVTIRTEIETTVRP